MQLTDEKLDSIHSLCKKYGIEGLVLYGSAVNYEKYNDIDLCYISPKRFDFQNLLNCISELIDIFSNDRIDLVYWSDASELLKNEMANNHQILFGDESYVLKFLLAGQRMYWDFRKYYDVLNNQLKSKING